MLKQNKLKNALLFTLTLIPIAVIGGYFSNNYILDTYDPAMVEVLASQVGGTDMMAVITIMQTVLYAVFCGFVGYIITNKIGLHKPFTFQKKSLLTALGMGALLGGLLVVDHFACGAVYPEIRTANLEGFTFDGVLASITYGGVIEEVMLRLFFMALLSLVIWKLFFRKHAEAPQKVHVIANIVAALAFAAGHLPATVGIFGGLDFVIVLRCFVLNGLGGYLFGEAFRKHGIGYAMIAHATAHIVKFVLFAIFA